MIVLGDVLLLVGVLLVVIGLCVLLNTPVPAIVAGVALISIVRVADDRGGRR